MTTYFRTFAAAMLTALLALQAGQPVYGKSVHGERSKEYERVKREMQAKKRDLRRIERKERSVLTDLEKVDRDIQSGRDALRKQQKQLVEAQTALRDIEANAGELNKEMTRLGKRYGRRLRALYKMRRSGNAFFTVTGHDLGMVRKVKYLESIAARDRAIIDEFSKALHRLSEQQAEITRKKEDIIRHRRSVESEKQELEAVRRRKSKILASVRHEKNVYEQALEELEESSTRLWAKIKKDEEERRSPNRGDSNQDLVSPNRLPWPLKGPVITRFGKQRHPRFGTMVFRRGIEIKAREGQEVRAVAEAQVVYADWYKGFGKLVILNHSSGFYSLYGNLSQLDVAAGDRVTGGQVIGRAGDTGSLKGSKLYFEIRRDGEAQDPLLWLSKR